MMLLGKTGIGYNVTGKNINLIKCHWGDTGIAYDATGENTGIWYSATGQKQYFGIMLRGRGAQESAIIHLANKELNIDKCKRHIWV